MNWLAPETSLWLAPLVPAVTALLVALSGRSPNLRDGIGIAGGLLLILVLWPLVTTLGEGTVVTAMEWRWLPGLTLRLAAEPLGGIFASVAGLLWPIATLYTIGYLRGNAKPRQTLFFTCYALAIAGAMGVALAGNLVTLFLFYELLTFSTYPLVTYSGTPEARRAGRTYMAYLVGGSLGLLLPAVVWSHVLAGHGNFTAGGLLPDDLAPPVVAALLFLFAFGIGKAALMPGHRWLPAAMIAPAPVSALLHAVAVVKAGVFCLLKVLIYVFGLDLLDGGGWASDWLLYVAGGSALIASGIALFQDNLKRRLAYSTVAQLAYVSVAAALFTPAGIIGGALHIAGHAFGKIILFFGAGAIETASGKKNISELDGIGWRMPVTMIAFTVGCLSLVGLPPTAGLVSKWHIVLAAGDARAWFGVFVLVCSTLLNAAYFMPIVHRAWARPGNPDDTHGRAPLTMRIAMILTTGLTLSVFLVPGPWLTLAGALREVAL